MRLRPAGPRWSPRSSPRCNNPVCVWLPSHWPVSFQYLPAQSDSGMFAGNSNWRGPVWIPVNTLLIRGLLEMYPSYGDDFKVESDHGDMLGDQNLWRKTYAYEQSSHISLLLRPARSRSLDVAGHVTTLPV